MNDILSSLASGNIFQDKDDEEHLKTYIISLDEALARCNQKIEETCKVDLPIARQLANQKILFLTNRDGKPFFEWTDEIKKRYRQNLVRKLCTKNIDMDSLQKADNVLFFNTACSGKDYLNELMKSNNIQLGTVDGDDICENGKNLTTKLSDGKTSITLKYIFIGGYTQRTNWIKKNGVVSLLDETLVHEFAHFQRDNNKEFKKESDKFLSFRFKEIQKKFNKDFEKFRKQAFLDYEKIVKIPNLSDEQRTEKFKKSMQSAASQFAKDIENDRVPVRAGAGSKNGLIAPNFSSEPGQYKITKWPKFVDGKLEKDFKFGATWLDRNPTFNEEEYIVSALAMYRYDRDSALKLYSKTELSWLAKNWRFGYLSK
ncbi:MAG: hypothetical protein ACXVCR_19825 [Bdellovibrio sp.]